MTDATALAGLRLITLADLPAYKAAINQTRRQGWLHYFAFMQVRRQGDVQVLPYRCADAPDCRAVHRQWVTAQGGKYPAINNLTFTRNCLTMADAFPAPDLSGVVVRVNGTARAFGFFGEMRADMGNLFISYSDHRVAGLHRFLTLQMLAGLQHLALVNSGDAAGAPHLAAAKQGLRPVGMQAMRQVFFG